MSTQTVLRFLMQTMPSIPDPVMVLSVRMTCKLQVFYDSDGGATDVFLSATLPAS